MKWWVLMVCMAGTLALDLQAAASQSGSAEVIAQAPEPVNIALGICGGILLVIALARVHWLRGHLHQWRVAIVHWIDAV